MSIIIDRELEERLRSRADAEGTTVNAFLEMLIDEREVLSAAIDRAQVQTEPLSLEDVRAKIERGFMEFERGEVVEGDQFAAELLAELDEIEARRRAG